jgi:hypothetical protein
LKVSFSSHHFSNLNFFFGVVILAPVSSNQGLWSLGTRSKVLTLYSGEFASQSVVTVILSNFAKIGGVLVIGPGIQLITRIYFY